MPPPPPAANCSDSAHLFRSPFHLKGTLRSTRYKINPRNAAAAIVHLADFQNCEFGGVEGNGGAAVEECLLFARRRSVILRLSDR